jgi:hypothetical protein
VRVSACVRDAVYVCVCVSVCVSVCVCERERERERENAFSESVITATHTYIVTEEPLVCGSYRREVLRSMYTCLPKRTSRSIYLYIPVRTSNAARKPLSSSAFSASVITCDAASTRASSPVGRVVRG